MPFFDLQEFRDGAKKLAEETGAKFILIEVVCNEDIVKRELKKDIK